MTWIMLVIAIALVTRFFDNYMINQFLRKKWDRDLEIAEIYLAHNQKVWDRDSSNWVSADEYLKIRDELRDLKYSMKVKP